MNSDERKSGNMDNIGERYKDKLTEQRDWMDSVNSFREETKDRMIDLNSRMNELELSLEESIQSIRDYLESAKKKS
jgi:predicted  nucleic acid-binding Zn-ribbon protein